MAFLLLSSSVTEDSELLALAAVAVGLLLTLLEAVVVSCEAKANDAILVPDRHSASRGNAKITDHFWPEDKLPTYSATMINQNHLAAFKEYALLLSANTINLIFDYYYMSSILYVDRSITST